MRVETPQINDVLALADRMAEALNNYLVYGNHTPTALPRYQAVLDDLGENAAEALAAYEAWKAAS